MRHAKINILLLSVMIACSAHEKQEASDFEEYVRSETNVFLSTETSDFVGTPTRIKAFSGGLYYSDSGFQKITKVDRDGNQLLSFGSQGQGPGEFESLTGFWVFDDDYLVYDYNGFKFITYDHQGNLVSERAVSKNPVNPDGFPPGIPITVQAISPHELLIPSRGRDESLFAIADIKADTLQLVGKAIGKHVESFDDENVERAFSAGEIPDIFMNMVLLGSSPSGIYSFQQTTGILEKYSYSGDLVWEKNLKIPEQEGLFHQIARVNQNAAKNNEPTRLFNYAIAMSAHEEGVAMLLNMPEEHPVTAAWVSNDGGHLSVVVFHGLKQEEIGTMSSFSVSPNDKRAYFLNILDGIIHETEWPV